MITGLNNNAMALCAVRLANQPAAAGLRYRDRRLLHDSYPDGRHLDPERRQDHRLERPRRRASGVGRSVGVHA